MKGENQNMTNDIKREFRSKLAEQHKTQKELAEGMGVSSQYISKVMGSEIVRERFVEICEELGYDVEVRLVHKNVHDFEKQEGELETHTVEENLPKEHSKGLSASEIERLCLKMMRA